MTNIGNSLNTQFTDCQKFWIPFFPIYNMVCSHNCYIMLMNVFLVIFENLGAKMVVAMYLIDQYLPSRAPLLICKGWCCCCTTLLLEFNFKESLKIFLGELPIPHCVIPCYSISIVVFHNHIISLLQTLPYDTICVHAIKLLAKKPQPSSITTTPFLWIEHTL